MSESIVCDGGGTEVESINELQNYLQSFNKEIGETTVSATDANNQTSQPTYYTIEASQVLTQNGSAATGTSVVAAAPGTSSDGSGSFPTLALVPDSVGGYVLIVQQPAGSEQVSNASLVTSAGGTLALARTSDAEDKADQIIEESVSQSVKQERLEIEKPNDISVYDFDEVNPPPSSGAIEEEEQDELMNNETEDMLPSEGSDMKSSLTTPKVKRPKKSPASTGKKHKISTPQTPLNPNSHMCNYCNYASNKRYLLSRHMKSHSEERPHKCGICERGFKTIASLQNHVNTHTGVRPHGCKYCDAAFTTSGELVRHVRYRHTHEKPHRCTECDYASVELSKLKRHMRCHTGERPYQCPHCTYASPDTYKLKRHLRIHTGEKPYECDVCHARFTQSNSLKAHKLIHSGNKPVFKCDQCPTTCGRKTDLRIHVQKLHTSDKPLTCKRCDQSFSDRYSFKIHLKSHEGEKCFKCDLCNYASVSARHLESHMLIHTDQKPFECDECDQSFRQKQLLKRHKNLYHNPEYIPPQPKEKTHECPHCTKAFRHKGNLMRHLVVHDPDAYKDTNFDSSSRMNDSHQLIDDESDENSQMIMPNTDEESLDPQTLQFTIDPSNTQMISGDQVVVFEVVQINNEEESNSQSSYATLDQSGNSSAIILDQSSGVGGKARRAILAAGTKLRASTVRNVPVLTSANGNSSKENIIIQLQAEDEEAANTIQSDNIIDDPDYVLPGSKSSTKLTQNNTNNTSSNTTTTTTTTNNNNNNNSSNLSVATTPVVPPPLVVPEDTKQIRDQMRKQKDLAECFGFKDDDEEDEAILSMPAAHAQ